jgi:hypothetical protein
LLPSRLPLTARLERAFAAQGSGLPSATRSLLLAAAAEDAAAEDADALGEVLNAAIILDGAAMTVDAFTPGIAAGLVAIQGTQLRFRHPLVRSAIYQAASLPERQAAHAALAHVLAGQPDRQVWHRAAAALGPDEQVAGTGGGRGPRRTPRRGRSGGCCPTARCGTQRELGPPEKPTPARGGDGLRVRPPGDRAPVPAGGRTA